MTLENHILERNTMPEPTLCDSCEEQEAQRIITLTNMESEVLDRQQLCLDCLGTKLRHKFDSTL